MPLTRAYYRQNAGLIPDHLFEACREIVPAGLWSEMGQLTPGSIEFIAYRSSSNHLTVDVFVEIEAFAYEDRNNLDERAENIRAALKKLFPQLTFAVWPKLVNAGWAADSTDPEFDGDMSMEAAIARATVKLAELALP